MNCPGMDYSPLRSITHRNDELQTHDQNTGVSQNHEYVFADMVTKRIDFVVGK